MKVKVLFFVCLSVVSAFCAEETSLLSQMNNELRDLRAKLHAEYEETLEQRNQLAPEILEKKIASMALVKKEIAQKETEWKASAITEADASEDGYGLWDQKEVLLGDLVVEYGAPDFLYVIPSEVASIKLSLHSFLPIPRESWNSLLEVVLSHNGVGYKQINPYTRELFLYKQDLISATSLTARPCDLELICPTDRVIHIFSPPVDTIKQAFFLMDRFRDIKKTTVYQAGQKVVLVGPVEDVKRLVSLHDAIWDKESQKSVKVMPIMKMQTEDALRILSAFFGGFGDPMKGGTSPSMKGGHDLLALALPQESSLILIGPTATVQKAEQIIADTEMQIRDPLEVTIEWYQCRHSDPIDLSEVLEKVYASLGIAKNSLKGNHQGSENNGGNKKCATNVDVDVDIKEEHPGYNIFDAYNDAYNMPRAVNPPVVTLGKLADQLQKQTSKHFIPYPKTGSILMVVRRENLGKIKELLRKLDVPKKMVQIEVLLCEKRLRDHTKSGLNILKLGSAASNTQTGGASYDASEASFLPGLFDFFFSRKKSKYFPAFDISYHFLLSQEDIRINATPSILTVNQTPATIAVVEEISINNGAAPMDSNKGVIFEKSYSRAQFGITLVMTPTIHEPDLDDESSELMVTLDTDVTFDTIRSDREDRPNVNRRHIQNQVRIPNGQTVILGGLLRKTTDEKSEKIPFLGEIPGFAKLFGTNITIDQETEMFVFITPKVVIDPKCDLLRIRQDELMRRPGDCPEFLERVCAAGRCRKKKLFEQSLKLIAGNINEQRSFP